jgi:DAK2 domain fusion protein YloV
MLEVLDGSAVRCWALSTLSVLGDQREEIDSLNVFPVPDGDTGTNLYLTFEAAIESARFLPPDAEVPKTAESFAQGALLGARGNSGVILAQMLRGWADVLAERGSLDVTAVREAFTAGDSLAWGAVSHPVDGTVLTVSRAAAEAAVRAAGSLPEVVSAAVRAAREALAETPSQLEVLRRAGVVDAGGRGLVEILRVFEDIVLERRTVPLWRSRRRALPRPSQAGGSAPAPATGYEVMYLLETPASRIPALRERLDAIGDSLVIVGDHSLWHVHVHTKDPGAAVEAGIGAGRPRQVRISYFGADLLGANAGGEPPGVGVVACTVGPGLADLFASAGAVVLPMAPGNRPSTADVLRAVRATGSEAVVVLPNDGDTRAVAEAAARQARNQGIRVSVLPTQTQVQGLAAAAVHDAAADFDEDLVRMSAAAGATRHGAVTVAARDAMTTAGPCRIGDALGVVQGDFAVVGEDLPRVAIEVSRRLLSGGGELLTVVRGRTATDELVRAVTDHVRGEHREVEITVVDGGQDRYPLLLGVE